jgi:DNA-binding response OmpR family regulator
MDHGGIIQFKPGLFQLPFAHLAISVSSGKIRVKENDMADKPLVLVVDDEAMARETISEVLSKDFVVETAAGGEEALAKVNEKSRSGSGKYDVILLDIRMPGMDGIETLKKIKGTFPAMSFEFVMLTAFDEAKYAWESSKIGASDYITKPFENAELTARIKMAVERKRRTYAFQRKSSLFAWIYTDAHKGGVFEKRKDLLGALNSKYDNAVENIPLEDMEAVYSGQWDGKTPKDIDPREPY